MVTFGISNFKSNNRIFAQKGVFVFSNHKAIKKSRLKSTSPVAAP
jgi:hypothetical protein